jgi:hypothetical protein
MKRIKMVLIAGITFIALSVGMQVASSAVASSSSGIITFEDAAQQVTLTIPTPPCAAGHDGCKWVLFVNEPNVPGKPVVGSVTGTTGVLTVKYPPNFCGVLQADARTGPPWTQVYGLHHTVEGTYCSPQTSTTTTTTLAPPTTPTSTPPLTAANQATPPTTSPATASPPVVAAATSEPASAPSGTTATAAPTQLPFTGPDVKLLMLVGLTLVGTGLGLLVKRRRSTP